MSAAPVNSGGFESITSAEGMKEGIIASALGGSGLIARQVLSTEKKSWGWLLRSGVAAMVCAYYVNIVSKSYISDENLRICVIGLAGFCSPELLNYGLQFIEAKLKAKVAQAGGGKPPGKGRKKKPNAKRS
jgi:hypothetical protein